MTIGLFADQRANFVGQFEYLEHAKPAPIAGAAAAFATARRLQDFAGTKAERTQPRILGEIRINERLRLQNDVVVKTIAEDKRKDAGAKRALMEEVDLVILCLPDEAAKETVALIDGMGASAPKILDASTGILDTLDYPAPGVS